MLLAVTVMALGPWARASRCGSSRRTVWHTAQRNEKISNKSSFGIIDIAEHSSTIDRIIVIVITARFIHDGAYRWRPGRHENVPGSHWLAPITCTRSPAEKAMRPRCSSNATACGFSRLQSKNEMWWPSGVNDCSRMLLKSATMIRPWLSMHNPWGRHSSSGWLPIVPNSNKNEPSVDDSTCTRWLPLSETMIRCRSSSTAAPAGSLNSPGRDPCLPTENKNERSIDDKNTNRWLYESTTMVRRWCLSIATPRGNQNSRSPDPCLPMHDANDWSLRDHACTRLLLQSTTRMRSWSWSIAMPSGCTNWPGWLPFSPNLDTNEPSSEEKACTRWFSRSTAIKRPLRLSNAKVAIPRSKPSAEPARSVPIENLKWTSRPRAFMSNKSYNGQERGMCRVQSPGEQPARRSKWDVWEQAQPLSPVFLSYDPIDSPRTAWNELLQSRTIDALRDTSNRPTDQPRSRCTAPRWRNKEQQNHSASERPHIPFLSLARTHLPPSNLLGWYCNTLELWWQIFLSLEITEHESMASQHRKLLRAAEEGSLADMRALLYRQANLDTRVYTSTPRIIERPSSMRRTPSWSSSRHQCPWLLQQRYTSPSRIGERPSSVHQALSWSSSPRQCSWLQQCHASPSCIVEWPSSMHRDSSSPWCRYIAHRRAPPLSLPTASDDRSPLIELTRQSYQNRGRTPEQCTYNSATADLILIHGTSTSNAIESNWASNMMTHKSSCWVALDTGYPRWSIERHTCAPKAVKDLVLTITMIRSIALWSSISLLPNELLFLILESIDCSTVIRVARLARSQESTDAPVDGARLDASEWTAEIAFDQYSRQSVMERDFAVSHYW